MIPVPGSAHEDLHVLSPGRLLARITAPHFVAGLVLDRSDRVTEAAPIVRFMLGWDRDRVREFVRGRGWRIERVI
jgi:hypothetical protein